MDLGISNRKFASIAFLLLTIIISLALSGLSFLINDNKSSVAFTTENFDSGTLSKTDFANSAGVDSLNISVAGGPVSKTSTTQANKGDPIKMKPMPCHSANNITTASNDVQYGSFSQPVKIVASSNSDNKPKPKSSTETSQSSVFDRIFDFMSSSNKPESFTLRH
jgi:hypothetical protein